MHQSNPAFTLWLTGVSGAGKSTLATLLAKSLRDRGVPFELLDGDALRATLCRDLGFSREDREENIRRIGFLCQMLSRHGITSIVSAISPYRHARTAVREKVPHFVEIYLTCPLPVLVERDPKGLYQKALAGEIPEFTGISAPYEAPDSPELTIDSSREAPEASASRVLAFLERSGYLARTRGAAQPSSAAAQATTAV